MCKLKPSHLVAALAICLPGASAFAAVDTGSSLLMCVPIAHTAAQSTIARSISAAMDKAVKSGGKAAIPATVTALIKAGNDPVTVVQYGIAYGGDHKAVVDAAKGISPAKYDAIRIAAIACGVDPTLITPPAGFGGLGGSGPGTSPMIQSEGGDRPTPTPQIAVSPS